MQGTNENTLVTDSFGGVNEAVDEFKLPKPFTPDARGGYFSEHNEFTRIPGKKLMPSTGGPVLGIEQLHFSDHSVVLRHQGTRYYITDDLSSLRSLTELVPPQSPLEPLI